MINKKRLIFVLIFLAAVLAVIFTSGKIYYFFTDSDMINLSFQKGVSFRLEAYKDDMLFINNEEILCINNRGEIEWNIVTGISEPAVSVRGEYILITDISGNTSYLYKGNKLINKFTLTNSIYCAKTNKNGFTVIATTENGYKGLVTVYSPEGNEIYKWHSGSGYVSDVDISDKNNVIVSQINTEDSFVSSKVLFFNIKKDKNKECATFENSLVSHVYFNPDNSFIALSDNQLVGFSSGGEKKYETDFDGRSLIYYNTKNMNNIVLAFKGSVNDTIIESYSRSGKLKGTYRPNEDIDCIDVNGELIITTTGRKLVTVSPSGKIKSKKDILHDINNFKIYSGRRKAAIVGGSAAMIYSIY